MTNQKFIRNFSIIAHIDHGKSTLSDRIIEYCGAVSKRDMTNQILDSLEIEQERGITIKSQPVRLNYTAKDGNDYMLNLIDTPGHVDFTYEVSRSLACCEGALLVIDATQGVEAQTIANMYLALEHNLEIIPVINKIDLPSADPERVKKQIDEVLGLDSSMAVLTSAKEGIGIGDVAEAIVNYLPAPKGKEENPLQALIFDSYYDSYRGVVVYFRVFEGKLKKGDHVTFMTSKEKAEVVELGFLRVKQFPCEQISVGEVGYLAGAIKNLKDAQVGDTITLTNHPAKEPIPGYKKATPMVFAGLYPVNSDDYQELREALEKLSLNDASLEFEPETSSVLGFGFRCGFLGLLHMEVIQERLEREFNVSLITTAPSVVFRVTKVTGEVETIHNPSLMPAPPVIDKIEEPYVKVSIITPNDYVGSLMELSQNRRGVFKDMTYLDTTRVNLHYEMPLIEMITDYFDQLKSRSRGYATLDYELIGYRESDLVKLDVLMQGEVVDALSVITHRDNAPGTGRRLAEKLKELIPKQLFDIPIQAAIGGRIVARETITAMRKNVLAKCYGGDISRKKKLLEKQKEGKKRMKMVGSVEIPQEAFRAILSLKDE